MPVGDNMFRPPIVGRMYPPSKRPDGTWRKPVKIRKGWRGDLDYGSDDDGNRMISQRDRRYYWDNKQQHQQQQAPDDWNLPRDTEPINARSRRVAGNMLSKDNIQYLNVIMRKSSLFCKWFLGIVLTHSLLCFLYIEFFHTNSFYGYVSLFLIVMCYFLLVIVSMCAFVITKYYFIINE